MWNWARESVSFINESCCHHLILIGFPQSYHDIINYYTNFPPYFSSLSLYPPLSLAFLFSFSITPPLGTSFPSSTGSISINFLYQVFSRSPSISLTLPNFSLTRFSLIIVKAGKARLH